MKALLAGVGLICSVNSFAADPKVELTSFIAAGVRTRAAELCGKVTGIATPYVVVKVTVDPRTENAAFYNILVGKEAKFCTAVITYHGKVEAEVASLSGIASPETIQLSSDRLE